MRILFVAVGGIALFISIACLVIYFFIKLKIRESPNKEVLKRKLEIVDLVSRGALFSMAIIYFSFKLFGEN